jgi:hypothetical protein
MGKLTYSIISNWKTTSLSNAERGPERVQSKYFNNAGSWSPTMVTVSPVLHNVKINHELFNMPTITLMFAKYKDFFLLEAKYKDLIACFVPYVNLGCKLVPYATNVSISLFFPLNFDLIMFKSSMWHPLKLSMNVTLSDTWTI